MALVPHDGDVEEFRDATGQTASAWKSVRSMICI